MKKTRSITALVITGLMLYAIINLVSAMLQLERTRVQTTELQAEIEIAEKENAALREKTESIGSDESLMEYAEAFFGYIDTDKIIFVDKN